MCWRGRIHGPYPSCKLDGCSPLEGGLKVIVRFISKSVYNADATTKTRNDTKEGGQLSPIPPKMMCI